MRIGVNLIFIESKIKTGNFSGSLRSYKSLFGQSLNSETDLTNNSLRTLLINAGELVNAQTSLKIFELFARLGLHTDGVWARMYVLDG